MFILLYNPQKAYPMRISDWRSYVYSSDLRAMAPPGHSTFYALAPVAHLGKAKADWDGDFGERFADAILDEVERRVAPGLRANLVTRFHYTPVDFGRDLSAHLRRAFSLEPVLWQSAWFRAPNRDAVLSNLYYIGAGTHPGAGIPGVVGKIGRAHV